MEVRRDQNSSGLRLILFCFVLVLFSKSVKAYENYTVGDSFGWYDKTEKPEVDYQKWAKGKNFSLGDFLIFNTNTNHSVIQTYNETVYKLCDYSDAAESDAIEWSAGNPSNTATEPVTVPVPLRKEGKTYFFSGDYDGDQCNNGQRLAITVSHGHGLPKDPSDDASGPASGPMSGGDNDESAPDTVVPANFDHPKKDKDNDSDPGDDDQDKSSASSSPASPPEFSRFFSSVLLLGLVVLILT